MTIKKSLLIGITILCQTLHSCMRLPRIAPYLSAAHRLLSTNEFNNSRALLQSINTIFLDTYAETKKEIRTNIIPKIPILLEKEHQLILLHDNKQTAMKYTPESYHDAKDIAHISCGIKSILMLQQLSQNHSGIKTAQEKYITLLESLMESINHHENRSEIFHHKKLIEWYYDALVTWKKTGDSKTLSKKLATLLPYIEPIIKEAAENRLTALHTNVVRIKKMVSPQEWEKIAVIIMGPQMPRVGELSWQYFNHILKTNETKPSACPFAHRPQQTQQRLIYAESITTIEKALDLLVTHIADEEMGEAILLDKMAMHSDVLANETKKILQKCTWKKELDSF